MATIYKFSASWCAPCSALSKTISSISDIKGVVFKEYDMDADPDEFADFNIRGVPTLVVVDINGKEIKRKVGALNAVQLQHLIDEVYHM